MQAISDDLLAILKSHFQAGVSGFRAKVTCQGVDYFPIEMQIDHSLQTMADAFSATFTNENGEIGLAAEAFPDNSLFTADAWYGDEADATRVFTGFIDKIEEDRDPRTVTIIGRDWAKVLLVQQIRVLYPQQADEPGAVRNTSNYVYLNTEISAIVQSLLTKAGWPLSARAIQPTNFVVDEYIGLDGSSYGDMLGELADFIAFNAFADENGIYRFQPNGLADSTTDDPPVPVYTFRSGEDIVRLHAERDDLDTKTRVRVTGPYTTLKDAWTELWHTNVIKNPTGVWHEPGDATHLNVADGPLRKVYRITQGASAAIVSSRDLSATITYLNGLSGDPSDATIYWTLDTPWILGGATVNNKIRKMRKSDNAVLATYNLPNQKWTDMKVGSTAIWLTNFTTDKIHKYSKSTGLEITSYAIGAHANPIGVAIDGSDLFVSFYAEATMLQVTVADPTTVVRTLHFSGTKSLGGEIDTDTHTELYACSGGLSLVYKYTLKEPVTTDVSVEAVNDALELALGVELDTGREIRRMTLPLKVVTSYAQAAEVAARWLDKVDQFRNVQEVGILGNPAIMKGDMVRVEDPVIGIANDFQVDTHRSVMSDTYLDVLSLVPWSSSYAGPGDIIPANDGFPTPVDEDTQFGATASVASGATHHVPWPTNLQVGELILVHLGSSPPSTNTPHLTISGAAGLTLLGGTFSAWVDGRVLYRFCDGTEGTEFTLTQDQDGQIMYRCYRIINAHLTAPPEVDVTNGSNPGGIDGPGPLTPTWGLAKTLWLYALAVASPNPVTSFPDSYPGDPGYILVGGGFNGGMLAGAYAKEEDSVSPGGAFYVSFSNFVGITIGVRPRP